MNEKQHQIVSVVGQFTATLTVEQSARREKASSPVQHPESPDGAKHKAVVIPGITCSNRGLDDSSEKASGERAFLSEKELLTKLPISRRTLANWKINGLIPYIKIGRRCLYDWPSVHGALLRRQRGGQWF
jgi:hypothetical protein